MQQMQANAANAIKDCAKPGLDGESSFCDDAGDCQARHVGTPQPNTVPGVCKTRGIEKRLEVVACAMPDGLEKLTKSDLLALVRTYRRSVTFDAADLEVLRSSTMSYLELLRCRVRERQGILEAADFARWCRSAGLLKFFRGKDLTGLEKLVQGVRADCEDAWKARGTGPWVSATQLEEVNRKLDNLATQLGAVVRDGQSKSNANKPDLHIA